MSEKDKRREYDIMISGEMYNPFDQELTYMREKAHALCDEFNRTIEADVAYRNEILHKLLGSHGPNITVEKHIKWDYGCNVFVGDYFYANFDVTILDTCPVRIGNGVLIGPGVHIYTVNHPLKARERLTYREYGKPVNIGDNCWIGGRSTICPGVTLGKNVVVAAGSVVTKSFGDDVVIGGNPAKIIKTIDNSDLKE